ncbi:aminotransferase class V-fold PLP-dependent enzyme [uncultured Fusobacterium sp.]|uniref:aminotransferase class V-fold PLP-dependent enzyme n=1 Tax=uncultured Fusobacterium sp. TaxID=159267 RepID=UPI0025EB45FA|nr:aminotransferase class V-fold PLP-dependent enzyme [uncultured Fusobacterium sp.]
MIKIEKKIIYFDNSATSFPKPEEVYKASEKAMRIYGANPGRGGHRMAVEASKEIFKVREKVANLFNIKDPLRIAFTQNSTYALNFAIKSCINKKGHVITTALEHNSSLRPLFSKRDSGEIELELIYPEKNGEISIEKIIESIKEDTIAVVVNHISNVTGTIVDIGKIGKVTREKGVMLIVDASQSAGYLDIDVERDGIDILCFTGHKSLYGLQGSGGIYIREGIDFIPIIEGGTGSFSKLERQPLVMPEGLEAGTLNTLAIVSLGAGIDFIQKVGIENIRKHEDKLTQRFLTELKKIPEVEVYGSDKRGPVVTLNIKGIDSGDLAAYLDEEYGILVRGGLHCAPKIHEAIGNGENGGVRFSFGFFNTDEEIEYAINAIKEIVAENNN